MHEYGYARVHYPYIPDWGGGGGGVQCGTLIYVIGGLQNILTRGMYGIYCTEARGRLRPRAEVNKCHTSRVHVL